MATITIERCETCETVTTHDVQETVRGEVIRCRECATVTTD